jgi:hypothetical protein
MVTSQDDTTEEAADKPVNVESHAILILKVP